MRILYDAMDQSVPGTVGGSVHTQSVAAGLAALGHDVHALVTRTGDFPADGVQWHAMRPPFERSQLRWLRARAVLDLARHLQPDVVMERYHNFAGEGIRAGVAIAAKTVLEVNAPIVDHPGSLKQRADRALLVRPFERMRRWQCAHTDLFVTPSRAILPADVPPGRVLEIEWGADTSRFHPQQAAPAPFSRPAPIVAVFAGAFRRWHGAVHLVAAIRQLRARGVTDVGAVFVGTGPEWTSVRDAARDLEGVTFTGPVAHELMPAALAAADVGVAPFDVTRHPPLSIAFYWSPLKVFEYMASGLPVVAPAIPRLTTLVANGREGLLYPDTADGLAEALIALRDPGRRREMGAAARARAVREYSWQAHCARLDERLRALVAAPAAR